MNSERKNEFSSGPISAAEESLRLIAKLPAPEGLVDRVQQSLRRAPRRARVFEWPSTYRYAVAMRGAAAAAIVLMVAGGGWSIYSHVQPLPAGPVVVAPARIGGNGFSSAGAMRKPDSPSGPVLTHAVTPPAVAAVEKAHPKVAPKHAKKKSKAVPVIAQPR